MRREKVTQLGILNGWKEIANYLGKGVRSVQRYEHELGLPIHRLASKSRASVMATKVELDAWVTSRPFRTALSRRPLAAGRTNQLGADFLQIDAEVALTFSGMALQARNPEKKRSLIRVARKAFDTIRRLRENIEFNEAERNRLDAKLERLKRELHALGEGV